jgi:hypothetical protein
MIERQVVQIWEQDRSELDQNIKALANRADRKEAEQIAGLSLDEAANVIVRQRSKAVMYFDLFRILRHQQAANMNIVQFYHAMRHSPSVRMNGIGVILRVGFSER